MCAEVLWHLLVIVSSITERSDTAIIPSIRCETSTPWVPKNPRRTIFGLSYQLPVFSSTGPPMMAPWVHLEIMNHGECVPCSVIELGEPLSVACWNRWRWTAVANHGFCWSFHLLPGTSTEEVRVLASNKSVNERTTDRRSFSPDRRHSSVPERLSQLLWMDIS